MPQTAVLRLLAAGYTQARTCQLAKIAPSTLVEWMKVPAFMAALEEERASMISEYSLLAGYVLGMSEAQDRLTRYHQGDDSISTEQAQLAIEHLKHTLWRVAAGEAAGQRGKPAPLIALIESGALAAGDTGAAPSAASD